MVSNVVAEGSVKLSFVIFDEPQFISFFKNRLSSGARCADLCHITKTHK